jgi:spore germination protein KA
MPVRVIRFGFVLMAGAFGLIGIYIALMLLLIHLCSLDSFGVSYMGSLTPFSRSDQKDTFIRALLQYMRTRPEAIGSKNRIRQRRWGKNP